MRTGPIVKVAAAMSRLSRVTLLVNIDHIATVRNARGGNEPDPVTAAKTCLKAGADGVVCHLREDRRHIRDVDVRRLRKELTTKLDLEMAATPEIVAIALRTKPDLVTLVPERRRELTTEGGLNVVRKRRTLKRVIDTLHRKSIPVSLFVDPHEEQIRAAVSVGADIVEIHTGEYADATSSTARRRELHRIRTASELGDSLGLRIHAGHGLDYSNTRPIAAIPSMKEISIGYAIIARALDTGLSTAVRDMVSVIRAARR